MRAGLTWTAIAVVALSTTVAAQLATPSTTLRMKEILTDTTPAATIAPGSALQNLEIGTKPVLVIRADAGTTCTAASPAQCPAGPALGGLADTSIAWSAEAFDGRTVIVRNLGPQSLTLRAEDAGSTARWRIAQPKVLAAGETVVLVYDGTTSRWQVVGAKTTPIAR